LPDLDTLAELPDLETDRLILRKLSIGDAHDIFAYASDPQVAQHTAWFAHTSLDDSRSFVEMIVERYGNGEAHDWTWGIALKESSQLIGTFFIAWSPRHKSAEIGYALGRAWWSKGLMTEAVREVIKFGFERMGLNRIEALCLPENLGSAWVMEKAGMSYEGTLRAWRTIKGEPADLKMYSILRREYNSRN
jgi:[ribosomal protein S5]-alanine N-acetyltransferase